jgi:hypothetical protein
MDSDFNVAVGVIYAIMKNSDLIFRLAQKMTYT